MIAALVLVVAASFFFENIVSFNHEWDDSLIISTVPNTTKLDDLNRFHSLVVFTAPGCLKGVRNPAYSLNSFSTIYDPSSLLPGNTIFINEHMSVGHGMYDYGIIQAFATIPIDRIVLQRAPCAQTDLCVGLGTWNSWFRGFYGAVIDAFSPKKRVPVYLRFEPTTLKLSSHILEINQEGQLSDKQGDKRYPDIDVENDQLCSQRIVLRNRNILQMGENVLSVDASEKFKKSAIKYLGKNHTVWYERLDTLVSNQTTPFALHDYLKPEGSRTRKLSVVFGYREKGIRRSCEDPTVLTDFLFRNLSQTHYDVHTIQLFNNSFGIEYQIALVSAADVFITEHGAFQSNVMFMRRSSLMIDLLPKFALKVSKYHEWVARNSGVFMKHVLLRRNETDTNEDDFYRFNEDDMNDIADIIEQYRCNVWSRNKDSAYIYLKQ